MLRAHPVALDGEPVFGITFVGHVIWRISEYQIGGIAVHEPRDVPGVGGVAHQQTCGPSRHRSPATLIGSSGTSGTASSSVVLR